ncbi:MAG: 2OG-Fe(II) oxygenase [Flavobacteriaceae bacterium]|nr:2OG-Fe(II) oxygenase [Flavobacteriaceae bacterium]
MKKKEIAEDIIIIEGFFTPEECEQFIHQSEQIGYEQVKINVGGQQVMNKGIRNNERVLFKDFKMAETLWQKLKPFAEDRFDFAEPIGLNEMFRFYKYNPGQRFKSHFDGSYIRNEKEASLYTFMVYLNDGYEGGRTKFHNAIITPKKGDALIFLHRLRHEGEVLKTGTKYILRTDIMYRDKS